jgi:hypothetical protein
MSETEVLPAEAEQQNPPNELEHAPLANLKGTAASAKAKALAAELAKRFPRRQAGSTSGKQYARVKTKDKYENASAAFAAELLAAYGDEFRGRLDQMLVGQGQLQR